MPSANAPSRGTEITTAPARVNVASTIGADARTTTPLGDSSSWTRRAQASAAVTVPDEPSTASSANRAVSPPITSVTTV